MYNQLVREDSDSSIAMPKMGPPPGQGNMTDSYTINRGDTLTRIASKRLPPNASPAELQAMIAQIAKENGIADPNRIQAGATLKMPPNAGMGPAPGSAPPSAPPIDSSLAGAPSPMPSAPLSPTGMRGTAIPQSIPMPMPSTGGGMGPSITPPTADQIKMSSMPAPGSLAPASQRGGFSFSESQVDPFADSPERAELLNQYLRLGQFPQGVPVEGLGIVGMNGLERYVPGEESADMAGVSDFVKAPPQTFRAQKFKKKAKKSAPK